jgi:hypothetical protein
MRGGLGACKIAAFTTTDRRTEELMSRITIANLIAAPVVVSAILAPAASAQPVDSHLPATISVPSGLNAGLGPTNGSEASPVVATPFGTEQATTGGPSPAAATASTIPTRTPFGAEQFAPSGPTEVPLDGQTAASGTSAASSGFDLGDAAIGAAGAVTLLGLGAGGALVARRTRRSHVAAS